MKIEELMLAHVEQLAAQGAEGACESLPYIQKYIDAGPSFAGLIDGQVIACVGLFPFNEGTYRCWAMLHPSLASKHFVSLNKAMRKWFAETRIARIETTVERDNIQGRRWVRDILGFAFEGMMHNYYRGKDAGLYARIS